MVWKLLYSIVLRDVKPHFNLSDVTKVSAQTFERGRKNVFACGEPYRFVNFIIRKYFTLILKMKILINCIGKFC